MCNTDAEGQNRDDWVNLSNVIYRMLVRVVLPTESMEVNVSMADLKTWRERLGHVGA